MENIKIFSDSLACAKIKHMNIIMHNINNMVQGHLSENKIIA